MTTPEARARSEIDAVLAAAGWQAQHRAQLNLSAARGVAVREFPLRTGYADYLLFVDRKAKDWPALLDELNAELAA